MKDKISIIVPIYNSQEYLDICIKSIVEQSYPNLEIILVNDGSTDNSGIICDEWKKKDSRIHTIHQQNGGLSHARNTGLEHSTGDYIAFIDSDDYIESTMLEKLYKASIKQDAALVECAIYRFSNEKKYILNSYTEKIESFISSNQALKDILLSKRTIAAWNKLYRKDILASTKFIIGRYNEDAPFLVELLQQNFNVVYLDEPLYYYRMNPNGITGKFSAKLLDGLVNATEIWNQTKAEKKHFKKEAFAYFIKNCIEAARLLILNNAVNTYPDKVKFVRNKIKKHLVYILFSVKIHLKLKVWALITMFRIQG